MAYSRDPNANFTSQQIGVRFPAPMNYVSPMSTGQQPVTYTNIVLHEKQVPVLQVDWMKGKAWVFESRDDLLENIVSDEMEGFPCACPMRDVALYCNETLQFLERGHSLLHPRCMCHHGYPEDRCRELGITPVRGQEGCSLPRAAREVTAQEIALELAMDEACFQSLVAPPLLQSALCNLRQPGGYYSLARFFFGGLRFRFCFVECGGIYEPKLHATGTRTICSRSSAPSAFPSRSRSRPCPESTPPYSQMSGPWSGRGSSTIIAGRPKTERTMWRCSTISGLPRCKWTATSGRCGTRLPRLGERGPGSKQ